MAEHDSKGVLEAAVKPKRRRDLLLPAMVDHRRRSRVAESARNILAKQHDAVADIGPRAAYDEAVATAKRRSDTDGRNIARIVSTR